MAPNSNIRWPPAHYWPDRPLAPKVNNGGPQGR